MSRLRLNHVRELGEWVIDMESCYARSTKAKRTEFMYDRLLFGLLEGHYPGLVSRQVRA